MKILYVLNSGHYGGMEWHVIYLAEGMVSKGYEVFVWCPDGPIVEEFKKVGAKVTIASVKLDIDPPYIFKLRKFIEKKEINIVHSHELKAVTNAVLAGWLAGVKANVAHTHTPISEWTTSQFKKIPTYLGYAALINLFAHEEIALTPSRKRIKIREGIRAKKLRMIKNPNAIKIQAYAIDKDLQKVYRKEILEKHGFRMNDFIWGCVGRISQEKGHEVLLEAFRNFHTNLDSSEKERHKLLLVGGGPTEEEMKEKVKSYKLENEVVITGRFAEEDHVKYFYSLDAFIHASYAEGFGITLIEAMISGIPTLASNLEVFKEVAGETITYFEVGSEKDLNEKMQDLLANYEAAKNKARNAQERAVKLYSYENFVDAYEEYYLELMRL